MSSLFTTRRKARKVGTDEEDNAQNDSEPGQYCLLDIAFMLQDGRGREL